MPRAREQIDRDNEYRQRVRDLEKQMATMQLRYLRIESRMNLASKALSPDDEIETE